MIQYADLGETTDLSWKYLRIAIEMETGLFDSLKRTACMRG